MPGGPDNIAVNSSQPLEQLYHLNSKTLGDFLDTEQRKISLSAFDLPDICPVQPAVLIHCLLRPATGLSQFPDTLTKSTF